MPSTRSSNYQSQQRGAYIFEFILEDGEEVLNELVIRLVILHWLVLCLDIRLHTRRWKVSLKEFIEGTDVARAEHLLADCAIPGIREELLRLCIIKNIHLQPHNKLLRRPNLLC
jgi:hypothetical protein